MNLHATQPHEEELKASPAAPGSPAGHVAGRFTYASGARPLQGYTIKRGIGHGGFGEVYYATSDAGKEVALKLIRRNWDIELRGVTQCLNLKHPNLLSLYDVRQDEQGDNWVVMELMSGESLEEVVARNPNGLPLPEVLAWMHGIAAGVAYLHDHGIVHRDLKPGNIFVDEAIVKIGDYGLSKFMSCSRRSGQTGSVGTVHYMAPEVANGRYGREIDIYALGIILFELLTGSVPFEGESVGEILMKHLTAEPDVSRLSEPYRTIVARTLAKDPSQRFNTVSELIAMLPPVPAGAILTAGARFVGPTHSAGFSLAPEIASAQANPRGATPSPFQGEGRGEVAGTRSQDKKNIPPTEEPIARWARETWTDLSAWWERKNFRPWQKLAILLVGLFVVFNVAQASGLSGHKSGSFGEFLIVAALGYGVYRRWQAKKYGAGFGRQDSSSPTAAMNPAARENRGANPVAANPAAANPTYSVFQRDALRESPTRRRWRTVSQMTVYQPGPPRERFTQLVGSMLLSAVICLVVGLVVMILRGESVQLDQYAWLALSSVLGSWSILIPAKLWDGSKVDTALRRFVMLVMGLGFGAATCGLANWMLISFQSDPKYFGGHFQKLTANFFAADGSPLLIAYLAYFGFLFVIPRWWRQADPRSTRLSIWHTGVAIFWSWVLTVFWPFPQPWGLMLTATIAIAVQLSAPWLTAAQRLKLTQPAAGD